MISRHFPELTPAAWHTAHARHERSPAIWNSYWHTDGQSGTFLKQAIEIYLFTMRFIYIRVLIVNKVMSVWSVRTTIFRMAHRVSWYFQHINLETMDVALLWFLQQILIHANHFCSPLSNGTPLIRSTFLFHGIFLCFWFLSQRRIRHLHKSLWLSAQKSRPAAAAAAAPAAAAAAVDLDQAADL